MKWKYSLLLILYPYLLFSQINFNRINEQAIDFVDIREYDKADSILNKGLLISKNTDNKQAEATFLNSLGYLNQKQKNYDAAINRYEQSNSIAEEIDDTTIKAANHQNLGLIYQEQGFYEKALSELLFALHIREFQKDTFGIASCLNTIGNIQGELNNFRSALSSYRSSLFLRKCINNKKGIAGSLNNIGDLYKKNRLYDSAIYYLNEALKYKIQLGDTSFMVSTIATLGETYHLKKDYKTSVKYCNEAYALRKKLKTDVGIALSANQLGALYFDLKQYTLSEKYLLEARPIGLSSNLEALLLENYNISRKLYRETNKTKEALLYDEMYINLKDTILNEKSHHAIVEMQIKYDTEKKDRELLMLMQERKIQADRLYFISGGIIVMIVISIILSIAYYQKKKDKQKIELLMQELNHRVKNNLQVIISMLNLQHGQLHDPEALKAIKESEERVKAMALIHQMLYKDRNIKTIKFDEFVETLTNDLMMSYGYSKTNLALNTNLEPISLEVDLAIPLGLIINELISNAFKHAFSHQKHPTLSITLHSKNTKSLTINIDDNGSGYAPINNGESFGIKMMNMLLKQINGKIDITNAQGTQVIVTISI